MARYEPMQCGQCLQMIQPVREIIAKPTRAKTYAQCNYQCECGTGYSNASDATQRRRIFKQPEQNIPKEAHRGELARVLESAFNKRNRGSKKSSFLSESSEDAITWTFFRHFVDNRRSMEAFAARIGLDMPRPTQPMLLLWGVPVPDSAESAHWHRHLAAVCDELKENRQSRTEPDVMLIWPDTVVLVEVKHRSPNERRPNYRNFDKYLDDELFAVSGEDVEEQGLYELVRNWRIGHGLARADGERSFLLVNLGPETLWTDAEAFAQQVRSTEARRFMHLTWRDMVATLRTAEGAMPAWLETFIEDRKLIQPGGGSFETAPTTT